MPSKLTELFDHIALSDDELIIISVERRFKSIAACFFDPIFPPVRQTELITSEFLSHCIKEII